MLLHNATLKNKINRKPKQRTRALLGSFWACAQNTAAAAALGCRSPGLSIGVRLWRLQAGEEGCQASEA